MSEKTDQEVKIKLHGDGEVNTNEKPNQNVICEIGFDSVQNRVYYTGQVVSGCVNIRLNEAKTVTVTKFTSSASISSSTIDRNVFLAIYAKIVGRGYCKWTTSTSRSTGTTRTRSTNTHMTEEFYMNKKIYYVGRQNAQERVAVQPGIYKYSFNCEIPDECHTSIEEETGFIRYTVAVVIDEGADKKTQFEEHFTVLSLLNLNDDVTFSYPMSEEIEQRFNTYCLLCCWETEPVKLTIRIPMRGFVPGQEIEISIVADNKSNQTFDNFNAMIFKKIEFYADNKTETSESLLTSSNCEGCLEGQSIARKLRITVPPTPRTESSTVCSISYRLKVIAFAGCCRDDPSVEFPITIGTYPIEGINAPTNGIVVTQQPTKDAPYQNQYNTQNISEPTQSQPLLLEGNVRSDTKLLPSTSTVPQRTIGPQRFEIGISNRSDKELENTFRPLYPVYSNCTFPFATNLQVQAADMKSDM